MGEDYEYFVKKVKDEYDFDLNNYKDTQMTRRLKAHYQKRGCNNFIDYYKLIKNDPVEREVFFDKVTINVTEFFRNRERWEDLAKMIKEKELHKINVLSAACSTGEEVYTIKMMLEQIHVESTIKAIDIDKKSLSTAIKGEYDEYAIEKLTDKEKERYFRREENEEEKRKSKIIKYSVKESLKENVKFERRDLLKDNLGNGYDLVICRNVMIYFKEEAKEELYKKFYQSMNKGGILYVGSTEQIFKPDDFGFEVIKPFFYRKK